MNLSELFIDPDDRVGFEPDTAGHWYALLDVTAFASVSHAESSIQSIEAPGQSSVNLYADMAGLDLAARGPRIVRMCEDRGAFDHFKLTSELARGISFLQLHGQPSSLEAHLIALREVSLPDGSIALFRYQDPRVIGALFPLLDLKQQAALLGPATRWLCTDPCGGRHRVVRDIAAKPTARFRLNEKQLAEVDEALLPYEVLAQTGEADSAVLAGMDPCRQLTVVRHRISQARAHGLSVNSDVSLYCILSLQLPEGFEDESPFKEAIAGARGKTSTFSQGLDRADPNSWVRWNDVLARQDGMHD